jgi:hypothetical protein
MLLIESAQGVLREAARCVVIAIIAFLKVVDDEKMAPMRPDGDLASASGLPKIRLFQPPMPPRAGPFRLFVSRLVCAAWLRHRARVSIPP